MRTKVLYTEAQIEERVSELAKEIEQYYAGKKLTVMVLMNGGMIFASDLVRRIDLPLRYDSLSVSSYVNNKSSGEVKIFSKNKLDVTECSVLIVDDILDTGTTLKSCVEYFVNAGAADVKTCVLLKKKLSNGVARKFESDWYCFLSPDVYVVGYGLDYDNEYRNLPYIAGIQ